MAKRLSDGNVALALLGNTLPTGAILVVLITMLGPISGAHFNPAVTTAFFAKGNHPAREAAACCAAQMAGALAALFVCKFLLGEGERDAKTAPSPAE